MSFSTVETSRFQGRPVTLYAFRYGALVDQAYYYTDAEQEVTFGGDVYQPIPIDRGTLSSSGDLDKSALEVRMPQNIALTELFRVYPPSQVVTLFIRQGHLSDPTNEFLVAWSGRVLSMALDVNEARFTCEPIATSLRRSGLRRHYQYGCPHVLYGDQCRANQAIATYTSTIADINGRQVSVAPGWNGIIPPEKFVGGYVQFATLQGTQLRTILSAAGNVLTLAGTANGAEIGNAIDILLGCNHQTSDCASLHNNIANYGGQPWIPLENPVGFRNQYY